MIAKRFILSIICCISLNSYASNVLELCWDGEYCDYTCNDGTEGYSETDEAIGSMTGCFNAATAACADHGGLSDAGLIMFMEKFEEYVADEPTDPGTGNPSVRQCSAPVRKTGLESIGVEQ